MMTNQQAEALRVALLQAFNTEKELRELFEGGQLTVDGRTFNPSLDEYTTGPLGERVYQMLKLLESHGRPLQEMLVRACDLRPENRELHEVVRGYDPTLVAAPKPRPVLTTLKPWGPVQEREEAFWRTLLGSIRSKKCTPVIGPGACRGVLPDETAIVKSWAEENHWRYPFADRADLTRISQYVALTELDPLSPHKDICDRYSKISAPDFSDPEEPHAVLADLDLPLYLTTNYDDFMVKALASRHIKAARSFPRWNDDLRRQESEALEGEPAQPAEGTLVYHLFGHDELPESMVVTEDDGIRFLASVAANKNNLFPPIVNRALGGTTLLFIGYGVFDWSFRVLVHTLLQTHTAKNLRQFGVAVQLAREKIPEEHLPQVAEYLKKFLEQIGIQFSVFWCDTREFTKTLRDRWEKEGRHAAAS